MNVCDLVLDMAEREWPSPGKGDKQGIEQVTTKTACLKNILELVFLDIRTYYADIKLSKVSSQTIV